ncbi:MAG: acid phosphatase [Alphaproteobacteria bacterium]|nr:acid phosphatase [Alphaproteobacteria bacterium]MBV8408526.1 acid phosphatase [Alphaproteobacteria bacterium]
MMVMQASCLVRKLAHAALALALLASPALAAGPDDVKHLIVIYGENRSFDNLYGLFPGADGLANAAATATQVDKNGKPYASLPQPIDTNLKPPAPDSRFPADLPNKPFDIAKYVPIGVKTGDLVHRYWQEIEQIDGGKMDKFVAWSDAAGLAMGHYDGSGMALWKVAQNYALADHFFHGAFGGSFLNHFFLVCACAPRYDNAPDALVAKFDADGHLVVPGPDVVTPNGYAVNTIQSIYMPHAASITDTSRLLPPQTMPTIGDRLSAKGVDWVWYSGGWDDALAGKPDPLFQFHHQPFAYFKAYADGTEAKAKHLKDYKDLEKALATGSLPPVTFYKPIGSLNQHPGYADVMSGDRHIADLIAKIEQSPIWKDTLVIVTYDEHGGYWDHVPPPKVDEWGPGLRVPTLFIGPMVKKGFVDHTPYETSSIVRFIEQKYGLEPLASRDRSAPQLSGFFE